MEVKGVKQCLRIEPIMASKPVQRLQAQEQRIRYSHTKMDKRHRNSPDNNDDDFRLRICLEGPLKATKHVSRYC